MVLDQGRRKTGDLGPGSKNQKENLILLDVDARDSRWDITGLYTAMSRTTHQLVILHPKAE